MSITTAQNTGATAGRPLKIDFTQSGGSGTSSLNITFAGSGCSSAPVPLSGTATTYTIPATVWQNGDFGTTGTACTVTLVRTDSIGAKSTPQVLNLNVFAYPSVFLSSAFGPQATFFPGLNPPATSMTWSLHFGASPGGVSSQIWVDSLDTSLIASPIETAATGISQRVDITPLGVGTVNLTASLVDANGATSSTWYLLTIYRECCHVFALKCML